MVATWQKACPNIASWNIAAVNVAKEAIDRGIATLLVPLDELSDGIVLIISILFYADVKEAPIRAPKDQVSSTKY
jgi:hypothetical protein